MVFVEKTIIPSDIKKNDIIVYNNPNHGLTIIHRVYDIWIDENNEVYIAFKGDSNNQPDITDPLENTIINKNVSFTFTDSKSEGTITINILVSYYKAIEVILGKVIFQIPAIGWPILVPFFSPLSLLLILYLLITIFLGFSVIISMIYKANKKFKKILSIISLKKPITPLDKKINSPNYSNFFIIPIFLVINIIFFTTVQGTYSVDLELRENDIDLNSIESGSLKWRERIILKGGSNFINESNIVIFIANSSEEFIDFRVLELVKAKGSIIKDELLGSSESFEEIKNYDYKIKAIKNTLEIVEIKGNINPSRKMNGHFAFFLSKTPFSLNNPHSGFFVRDFYRKSYVNLINKGFDGIEPIYEKGWKSSFELNGVQELISFHVKEEAVISGDGILLEYHYLQSESAFLIPEVIFILIPIVIYLLTVKILHRKIQKEYSNRISILLEENGNQGENGKEKV